MRDLNFAVQKTIDRIIYQLYNLTEAEIAIGQLSPARGTCSNRHTETRSATAH